MVRDIKEWCMTCEVCQKAQKAPGGKAPLNPSPVITEPFSCIAFDLVGPLTRTTSGYKCILEKWFPLQGELAQFYVRTLYKIKIERRKRRQNKNRPINLPQGNNIVHILRVNYLILNLIIHNKYISTIYIHTYILTNIDIMNRYNQQYAFY